MNGLLRDYFPKGSELGVHTAAGVVRIAPSMPRCLVALDGTTQRLLEKLVVSGLRLVQQPAWRARDVNRLAVQNCYSRVLSGYASRPTVAACLAFRPSVGSSSRCTSRIMHRRISTLATAAPRR
jgi:hypothetical protein